jgi:brefeldin A-inhibited guanine nucleotide-exchange protein
MTLLIFLWHQIDRIMEKFAERYTTQNPEVFPTADAAFILAFSIIMLNTDLHNPAIKEERRMTKEGFVRNNSGICNGENLPEELLHSIFDRIKASPISLKEDDDARETRTGGADGEQGVSGGTGLLFSSPYTEIDRKRENDYQKERDEILRSTESLLRRKKKGKKTSTVSKSNELGNFVRTMESGLRDEYVIPMFDVTWGPALAVFSTVMESANGTMGVLLSIASDKEIELAALNAASSTEVCLSGFQLAIRIAALCGNDTARSAYVHALSNFSCLGTGRLLEHRHVRCVQTLLEIARDDGELLGSSWEYVFKALSEVARLNRLHEAMAKANRAHATLLAKQKRKAEEAAKPKALAEKGAEASTGDGTNDDNSSIATNEDSVNSILYESIEDDFLGFEEEGMDSRAIDETNARIINENMGEDLNDAIYDRSSALSTMAIKDFMFQLCRVSRMEISGYGGHVGNKANDVDLTAVHYRQQHTLLTSSEGRVESRNNQPDIYSLQKLVEVTHYNMDLRPRLIFSAIWSMVSGHLTSTALHSNAAVAIYAVDSFRQLSIQFLKREELGVFEFQRNFLKPYEVVMTQCKNESVKEFLLKAVEQIILLFGSQEEDIHGTSSQKGTLRSGWRPLMTVIGLSSTDTSTNIANLGFKMLTSQLQQSLNIQMISERMQGKESSKSSISNLKPIRADKFVDLVDSLLMTWLTHYSCFVSGSREDVTWLTHYSCLYLAQGKI